MRVGCNPSTGRNIDAAKRHDRMMKDNFNLEMNNCITTIYPIIHLLLARNKVEKKNK